MPPTTAARPRVVSDASSCSSGSSSRDARDEADPVKAPAPTREPVAPPPPPPPESLTRARPADDLASEKNNADESTLSVEDTRAAGSGTKGADDDHESSTDGTSDDSTKISRWSRIKASLRPNVTVRLFGRAIGKALHLPPVRCGAETDRVVTIPMRDGCTMTASLFTPVHRSGAGDTAPEAEAKTESESEAKTELPVAPSAAAS
jgi:hypothetical protein